MLTVTILRKVEAGLVVTLLLAAISFAFWLGALQQKVNDLKPDSIREAQDEALSKLKAASLHNTIPCKATLGELPTKDAAEVSYQIPQAILANKDRTTEIQVYIWIQTGANNSEGARTFLVSTEGRGQESNLPLRVYAYNQPAWSYNSDTMWLPFPDNDHVKARREGSAITGGVASGIEVLACR